MDELTSRTALCSSVASRYSTIAASVPSPARSTRPYCFGSSGSNESTVATASLAPVRVDELAEEPSGEQRRVPGEHEDVVGTALESSACAAHRVTRSARLLLYRDVHPVERGGRRRRRDDDDRIRRRAPGTRRAPSRPSAGRGSGAGAWGRRSACACRVRPPSRRLRASSHRSPPRRLGRQDSNLGSRDQNPLPYHLATPQQPGHLATHDRSPASTGRTTNDSPASERASAARIAVACSSNSPYTVGPAPVTSARNAPAASSSVRERRRGEVVAREVRRGRSAS